MKPIFEYMQDFKYDKMIFDESMQIIADEMVNEAFKAEMLTNLAKEISKAEKEHKDGK